METSSSTPTTAPPDRVHWWTRFWHKPVRAERLALTRILLGLSILTDQLFQLYPRLMEFFGPDGVAPAGWHDAYCLRHGRWTVLFFNHDDPSVLYPLFWAWVGVTAMFTLGLFTRVSSVVTWLLTMAWVNRNTNLLNGGDDAMQVCLFLTMLTPCGKALSLDAWIRRKRTGDARPVYVAPWGVRLLMIQLCVIYLTTGLVKLFPFTVGDDGWPDGTWWQGSSVHYVLNYVTMSRWSFAQFAPPFWLLWLLSHASVGWEVLFSFLVLNRWTRTPALVFGLLFHLGIWFTIEVGWFSFYTMSFYGVWTADWYWKRWDVPRENAPAATLPTAA